MDFSTLNDEQLAEHLNQVLAEMERRKALELIPEQIRELTAKYIAGGGRIEELQDVSPLSGDN